MIAVTDQVAAGQQNLDLTLYCIPSSLVLCRMRSVLLPLLLFTIAFTADGQKVVLGPDVEVTARIEDAGEGRSSHKSVATVGEEAYVVWSAPSALMLSVFDRDGSRIVERTLLDGIEPLEALIVNDGSRLVVLWRDATTVRIAALSSDGELIPSEGVEIGADSAREVDLAVAGDRYLAVWWVGKALHGRVLDRNLGTIAELVDTDFTVRSLRVASDGETFLLTWTGVYLHAGLYTRTIASDGALGQITRVDPKERWYSPTILWSGSEYVIASATSDGLTMAFVDSQGSPLRSPVVTWPHGFATGATMAPHPSGFLLVAEHWVPRGGIPEVPQPTRLYSFVVSPDGERLTEERAVSTVDLVNSTPSLTGVGSDYFASWSYTGSGYEWAVRGTVIRGGGEVLFTDEPIPGVTISSGVRAQSDPRVVRGDGVFLAIWLDQVRERNERVLKFARLDDDGRSMDGTGIELSRGLWAPSLACGKTKCLVAYQLPLTEPQRFTLVGRWISRDGSSISQPFTIAPVYIFSYCGELASDGENFATVAQAVLHVIRPDQTVPTSPVPQASYQASRPYWLSSNGDGFVVLYRTDGDAEIHSAHFDSEARLTSEATVLAGSHNRLAIAGNGEEFLLLTEEVDGLRLSSKGAPIGGPFHIPFGVAGEPAVAWNADHWVVTWNVRNRYAWPVELYVGTVGTDGLVRDRSPVGSGGRASVAGSDDGRSMLLFPVAFDANVFGSVTRLHARPLETTPGKAPRRHGVRRP